MRQSTKTCLIIITRASHAVYRAALPLSRKTLDFAAGIIRRHRKSIGSRWRKLNPEQQALLVLACLRKGETFAERAAGFGVGTTTAWRYVEENLALLAARAPELRRAVRGENSRVRLRRPGRHPHPHLPGRRRPSLLLRQAPQARDEPAGHRQPGRDTLWVSGAPPGSVHDKKAEWVWGVLDELRPRAWSPWPIRATRVLRTRRSRTGDGTSQNRRRRPIRPARNCGHPASARTPSSRPAQDLAYPRQAPLPLARRPARQGHSRIADPRGMTGMETVHWLGEEGEFGSGQRGPCGWLVQLDGSWIATNG